MIGAGASVTSTTDLEVYLSNQTIIFFFVAVIGSTPLVATTVRRVQGTFEIASWRWRTALTGFEVTRVVVVVGLFLASAVKLSAGTYNPFIYFRF